MLYFRSVSRFVCCSASVASHLIADGVPKERVDVAENAIAFERLDHYDTSVRASLALPEGTKLALMFGYNFEVKGVDLAVEAVRSTANANIFLPRSRSRFPPSWRASARAFWHSSA
jgi:glycosyltransferase involved in cell wall biosynthesis